MIGFNEEQNELEFLRLMKRQNEIQDKRNDLLAEQNMKLETIGEMLAYVAHHTEQNRKGDAVDVH
jgi:hypothetical protein